MAKQIYKTNKKHFRFNLDFSIFVFIIDEIIKILRINKEEKRNYKERIELLFIFVII